MALNFNNPGNIRLTSETWVGQVKPGDSTAFVTFSEPLYGYRALYKLIINYINGGFNNLNRIVYKYAPPGDNNPSNAYVQFLENYTGLNREQTINPYDFSTIFKIGMGISRFETGQIPNFEDAEAGLRLVLTSPNPVNYAGNGTNILPLLFLAGISLLFIKF